MPRWCSCWFNSYELCCQVITLSKLHSWCSGQLSLPSLWGGQLSSMVITFYSIEYHHCLAPPAGVVAGEHCGMKAICVAVRAQLGLLSCYCASIVHSFGQWATVNCDLLLLLLNCKPLLLCVVDVWRTCIDCAINRRYQHLNTLNRLHHHWTLT